ncbi:MAG: sigma-70 family RNA polymerase sigma factor, partial [Anaerolineae bacterium]
MTDDEELLSKAKQLDPAALQVLHRRFYGPVARYIQLKVGNSKVVEDLSGEVFVRVLEGLQRGQSWRSSPQAWIMGIARHVVADYYRRQERAKEVRLTDYLPAAEEDAPPHQAMLSERKRILWQAIQQLTDDQRDVVLMRFMGGVTIQSVAKAINKTPGAVKALQHRALRALAQ